MYWMYHFEEARGRTRSWTAKLASYCTGKNSSRDFFKSTHLPLDPGVTKLATYLFLLWLFDIICDSFLTATIDAVKSCTTLSFQEPDRVSVFLKEADGSCCPATLPVQLPHKLLDFLFTSCGLVIPDEVVNRYWNHLEQVNDEMAVTSANFRRLAGKPVIPIGLHGDEAAMGLINGPHEKIIGFSLNLVLFRPRATRLSRFLLFAVEQQKVWSLQDTIYPMLNAIVESLNRCAEHAVASRRFLVIEIRGDQVWIRYMFQHHSWWKRNEVCYRCDASCKGPISYLNYDGWLPSKLNTDDFVARELQTHPICSFPEWKLC